MNPLAPEYNNTPVAPGRPRFGYAPEDPAAAPAVTIVTPYYDTGEIFMETAQSVLSQSLQQWEWLIVNDGSCQAEAVRILGTFRDRDPRIKVIDMDRNRGLPAARNAGLRAARAGYVFFLDSDDLLEPTALEKTAWSLESYPEFGFCKGFTVDFGAREDLICSRFESGRLFLSRNIVTIRSLVRTGVARSVGGFDESLVHGLEDWEFWLRCASQGHWGRTIPEFLDWYRRRQSHADRWAAWTPKGVRHMRRELRRRYPELYAGQFPPTAPQPLLPYAPVRDDVPFANLLVKDRKRILLVLPWMAMGGSDKFNLDLIGQLQRHGYGVSVVTTLPDNYPWYGEFARLTPDIFILPNFLRPNDYPRFLSYLVHSRRCDTVLVSNSEMGHRFLPYLRARCPDTALVDFSHMEEEYWDNGGHPRRAAAYQDVLDLNLVSTQHLKEWMVGRGANAARIELCHTNVDTDSLAPDRELRSRVRRELDIALESPVLLYAGRLCRQKQPHVFARVMYELRARGLAFVCLVAGDGEERRRLARTVRRRRLGGRVRMLGAVSSRRMRDLLAASDILFLPSLMEGIALTVFEAMAMEVVPVGADVGGQSELVTAECGILIKPGSEDQQVTAYADALEQLLRSPEQRSTMARAARARVCAGFRIEQMGDRVVELLEQAERNRRAKPAVTMPPRLGTEHAAQAIEHERMRLAALSLWKYGRVEATLRTLSGRMLPAASLPRRALDHMGRTARLVKDAVWIVGHRIKVSLRES